MGIQGRKISSNFNVGNDQYWSMSGLITKAKWLAGVSALATSTTAMAAPPLVISNVGAPTQAGSGQGKRAIWVNGGTVGADTVDIVGVITTATLNHNWTTTGNRPSITSVGQDNIMIEWRLYRAGTYNVATDSGGVPVTADVHVQINDVDGPNNERVFTPVCGGDVKWVRIDASATTGRAFGTVSAQPELFSLIGDANYNNEPRSGLEVFYPDRSVFKMGRTANSSFFIRLDNPSYSEFNTLDYECADFTPPVAVNDSKEGVPGSPTVLTILNNDSFATDNNNATNNNSLLPSEAARSSVNLIAPPGATGTVTDAKGDVVGFTVPGEGSWAYSDTTGALTFTPDPSFKGYATTIQYTVENALGVASNAATVTVWYPAIGVTKSSIFNDTNGDTYGQVGETIDYIYQVKAYGAEPLQNVAVTETGFTGAGTLPVPVYDAGDVNSDTLLDLSETWTFKATYSLVAADLTSGSVTNSATGTGRTAAGTVVNDISDSSNPGDGNGTGTSGPGPNNGDPTRVTLTKAPIAASNNSQTGTIFGNAGTANAYNVLSNDLLKGVAPTPSTVTLTVTTPASNPGVTLDTATGLVSVAAGTPAGNYTIDYQICEIGNPTNCASAQASIVVTASTPITAATDSPAPVTSATGGVNIVNALTNDRLNNVAVAINDVNLTVTTPASNLGVSLDPATGLVSVAPGTPVGSYTITYEICEKASPANCASSTVTVVVSNNPIAANNDSVPAVNGRTGNANAFNAFANDMLNGAPVVAADVNTTVTSPATPLSPGAPIPTLNPATGIVAVPPGTPAGNYTIGYEICEKANPTNCRTATITVAVSAALIAASNDSAGPVTTATGGSNLVNALTNDQLNNAAVAIADINLSVKTPASNPGVTLDVATGQVSVAPGTPAGSYTIAYEICEKLNASNWALANVVVQVNPTPITAATDLPAPVAGFAGGNDIINAFANDRLNGAPVVVGDITATITTAATPATTGAPVPVLDPATGLVDVPANTPAGIYTIEYRICENANSANCANASVAVVVTAAPVAAVNDSVIVPDGVAGVPSALNVFDGDSINGVPATPSNATLSVAAGSSVPNQLTFDSATGVVGVRPNTPAGTYSFSYQICETLNPTNCRLAMASVTVDPSPIIATDDNATGINGTTGATAVANAFTSDLVNGLAASPSNAMLSVKVGTTVPAGLTFNTATGSVDVASGTPAGSYVIDYTLCEKLNPTNCRDAKITVNVSAAPMVALNDTAIGLNGATGVPSALNVLAGDTVNGVAATPSNATLSVATGSSVPAQLTFDPATGVVGVKPGTLAGTYSFDYQICETLNPANCRTATASVTVDPAPIVATNDSATGINGATGATAVANAFTSDTVNNVAASPGNATLSVKAGTIVPAGLTFNTATGSVDVAPGTPAGSYVIEYTICETLNPANCKDAKIRVDAVAGPIAAMPDTPPAVNGTAGNPSVVNAFANDLLNGIQVVPSAIIATVKTPATNPGVVLDPATGNVSVAPGTPAGSYKITYEICEKLNPTNCATSSVTVVVDAAPIAATNDDAGSVPGIAGRPNAINAVLNDKLNGQPVNIADVTLTVTAPAANPGITLDPATGMVSIAANTPAGTYSIGYQICERLNPANCASATVAVVVQAPAISATPDAPAPVNGANGGNDIVNAFTNDVLNGVPVVPANITASMTSVATPATPGAPVPVMDPVTGYVDVPAGTPAGTYTIGYQICETLNPSNCSTSSVTIVVQPPAILAAPDSPAPVRAGMGNPNAVNAFANDTLNGVPVALTDIIATVMTPASNPGVVLDPATGNVAVSADVPAGTYSIEYQICERLNPSNCTSGKVTVVVELPLGAIEGTVYSDLDGDETLDPGEARRANWIVEVMRDGVVVATARTDQNGNYRVEGLPSGPGYSVGFRNPENNVLYNRIENITLGNNTTVVDQNQPIDPSGVFYNSVTRQPLAGVNVRFTDANGVALPVICFGDPSQANQTTGASGEYGFDLIPGAAAQCPLRETVYRIVATPQAGFAPNSTVILPLTGPFDPTGSVAPVRINPAATVPTSANPPYYLDFRLAAGDPDIIFNHIPLDPFLTRNPLVVTKTSVKRNASVGDIVPYEITVRNTENVQRAGVTVVDILPPGMKYVMGTASVDAVASEPVKTDRQLSWAGQIIPANGSRRYNLTLIVGAGVTGGEKVNTGVAENGATGIAISNRGTAVVSITPNAVFDCSELLGKVFEDSNRNGYQDENEPGVPSVRLATVNGQLITTDEFGRYHIACAAVPDARIGSNFVLKVDTRTLPIGWDTTTDNPRSIRLTRGKFGELNFGVAPREPSITGPGNTPANRTEKGE